MLKKSIRTITTLALIAVLTTSLVGCNSKTTDSNSQKEVKSTEPVNLKIFANFNPAEPNLGDKTFYEKAEKAVNVKLQFEIPPSSNYKERLQLMLTSGQYADVVFFSDPKDPAYINAVETGIIASLNEYIEKAPNLKKYSYPVSWDGLKVKGDNKIYGIPRSSLMRTEGFMIRKDWLDNLGISLPKDYALSLEEFADILRKFTLNDPDKNGKADTFGYAGMAQGAYKTLNIISNDAFGLQGWQEYKDEDYKYMDLTYSKKKDNYKKALEYTAKLYKEKVIDPDSPVNDQKAAVDRFKKGLNGVLRDAATNVPAYLTDMKKINPNADLSYVFLKSQNGKVESAGMASGSTTGIWGAWAVTTACKNPEAAVKLFDWMLGDEGWGYILNGIENVTYKTENGKKVDTQDKYQWARNYVRRHDSIEFYVSSTIEEPLKSNVSKWVDMSLKNITNPSKDAGFTPKAASSQLYVDYAKTMSQELTKILVGQKSVNDYNKILEDWYKAGGEDYIKEMNEYIKKLQVK
jgi:putative aldouronate transport system substrate-binding protein